MDNNVDRIIYIRYTIQIVGFLAFIISHLCLLLINSINCINYNLFILSIIGENMKNLNQFYFKSYFFIPTYQAYLLTYALIHPNISSYAFNIDSFVNLFWKSALPYFIWGSIIS